MRKKEENLEMLQLQEELKQSRLDLAYKTRELLIEAALERVRARTMAMQKSEELHETSQILFQQMKELGEPVEQLTIGIIKEIENIVEIFATFQGSQLHQTFRHSIDEPTVMNKIYKGWKDRQKSLLLEMNSDDIHVYNRYRNDLVNSEMFSTTVSKDERRIIYAAYFSKGMLALGSNTPLSEESHRLLERFASVFDGIYTRFLDLQKAEAQAREAEIELALERVRSKTIVMQKSDELLDIIIVVSEQLQKLNFKFNNVSFGVNTETYDMHLWMAAKGHTQAYQIHWTYLDNPGVNRLKEAQKQGLDFFSDTLTRDENIEWLLHVFECNPHIPFFSAEQRKYLMDSKGYSRSVAILKDISLVIGNYSAIPYSNQENAIFRRFANVFEQAYTRFLDLQKAEAQARESQVEAALERIRSRSMAMHKSDELLDVISVVSEQLQQLDFKFNHVSFANNDIGKDYKFWTASKAMPYPMRFNIPYLDIAIMSNLKKAQEKSLSFITDNLTKEDQKQWHEHLLNNGGADVFSKKENEYIMSKGVARSVAINPNILLILANYASIPYSEEENKIIERFGKVFEQSYTRFLDLQKAETQAREAEIELALERIRSKAMAIQKSDDLNSVVAIVFDEFRKLDLGVLRCGVGIFNKEKRTGDVWSTSLSEQGTALQISGDESFDIHPLLQGTFDAWLKQKDFSYVLKGEDLITYYKALGTTNFRLPGLQDGVPTIELKQYYYTPTFQAGNLYAYSEIPFSEDSKKVMHRFAGVLNLTYNRFLDLQKAEAQAREAHIEASLEKVRSKTMAMHNSQDVGESVAALFDELTSLGVLTSVDRCGIGIMQPNEMMELWTAENATGKTELTIGYLNMQLHTLLKNVYQNWLDKKETYQYILEGEDKLKYYEAMQNQANYKIRKDYYSSLERIVHTDFFFKEGCLYVFSQNEFTREATSIFVRFVNVFGQTYRRYLDLQKAEAQAREAQIEAGLEKVRSRTLAMQSSNELAETAAEVFKQLIGLGIEPNRLYIGIVKDENGDMEMWATDEDGTQVGQKFMFNKNENASVKKLYDGWAAKKKSVIVDMEGKELEDYFHYLNVVMHIPFKGGLTQKRRVQSVAYFSKGFIGMASPDGQGSDTLQLLERFAAVFNLTFTRFNDLKIAEAHAHQAKQDLKAIKEAKQKAEAALIELQATQSQLIQSEKMASLGELTAGIAHEIQNPLNFVNNFSEVNNELIQEIKEERKKKNEERDEILENELLEDIANNLEKISHHGKRADAIVKGMLQHSRTSSGVKEPTDINKLAEEYLRLAYHGLRAKDKNFNATLETDFDDTIGKIAVIPQDLGRVILNLITNAFYAVNEKKRSPLTPEGGTTYEPTVWISTKKLKDKVIIAVRDNGNGIPKQALEKIFLPFFTTKPAGQGTGLGLSMSYDIISKGHGGELTVKTIENEGTTFRIELPVT